MERNHFPASLDREAFFVVFEQFLSFSARITIHSLPDAKYYTYTGGTFRHNMDGFVARVKHPDGTVEELRRTVP